MGLYSNDLVQDQLRKAQKHLATHITDTLAETLAYATDDENYGLKCKSPIEVAFWLWWQVQTYLEPSRQPFNLRLREEVEVVLVGGKKYRFDFVVEEDQSPVPASSLTITAQKFALPVPKIAVELDGHDWHERTKEQVIQRNTRDRDLQMADWKVFHFSGSELVRKPVECVSAVWDYANSQYFDLYVDIWRKQESGDI